MKRARHMLRPCLHAIDAAYRRGHGLEPVAPLLHVGVVRYRGEERRFADGTELRRGDPLGTLHFDNACIATLGATSRAAIGLGFARMLFPSLYRLAALCRQDSRFREVQVFRGIGCNRHGGNIGFLIEPYAAGWHTRLVALHTRLLIWAYTPSDDTAAKARPAPTVTWLTRAALLNRFGAVGKRCA
jgi:hypothetical protein